MFDLEKNEEDLAYVFHPKLTVTLQWRLRPIPPNNNNSTKTILNLFEKYF